VVSAVKTGVAFFATSVALGAVAEGSEELARQDTIGSILKAVLGAVATPFAFWVAISSLVATFARRARIEVWQDRLVIHHRALFRKPVTIDRGHVAAADFDIRPARLRRFRDHKRFELPLQGDEPQRPEWLYSKVAGSPFVALSQVNDVPNAVICFREPLLLKPARRWQKPFPARVSHHPPLHRHRSRGLLIRFKDAYRAREVLEGWTVVRPLSVEDLEALAPSENDVRKANRLYVLDGVMIVAILVTVSALPFFVNDEGPGALLSPGTGVCAQVGKAFADDPTPDVSLDPPALLESYLPTELGDEGFFFLQGGTFEEEDLEAEGVESVIAASKPDRAFFARYASPVQDVYVYLLQLASSDEANDLFSGMLSEICSQANETFEVSGVPGALGMRWMGTLGVVDHVVMQRDEFAVWLVLVEKTTDGGPAAVLRAARSMDSKMR
jgi:hypothetical protein